MNINLLKEAWDKVQFDYVCKNKSTSCMSYGCKECLNSIIKKALEKQMPQEPNTDSAPYNNTKNSIKVNVCPNCDEMIEEAWDYCPYCGQKIKWEQNENEIIRIN